GFCKQSVACLDSSSTNCVCDSFNRSKRLRYNYLSWLQVRFNSARTLWVSFSIFIRELPFDFAVINWGFVVLYLTCRLWPNFGSARSAMWLSMVAMSLPNVFLFAPAWEMVSNASGVGQGIGVILAMISLPIITIIWPGSYPSIFDAGFGIGFVISALMAPIPFFGLIGWLVGQLIGWTAPIFYEKQLCGLSPLLAQSRLSESSSRLSAFCGQSGHGDAGRSRSSPPL